MAFVDDDEEMADEKREPMIALVVRVPRPLKEELEALAHHRDMEFSQLVRYILRVGNKDLRKLWGLKK